MEAPFVHRYIPNSAPGTRELMLTEAGLESIEEIFAEIPEALRFKGKLDLPVEPLTEMEVAREISALLEKNTGTDRLLSFLGAGCWPHYVPALCDEVAGRSEFQTAYFGSDAVDLGRYQAMFEYQSMVGDLLAMDVVCAPVYDGSTAAGDAMHMTASLTGRKEVLVPGTMRPDVLRTMTSYAQPWMALKPVRFHPESGHMDVKDLERKLSRQTAAVFVEQPGYLGFIELQCEQIAALAHAVGALVIMYVNPASLGVLSAPGEIGADIACGEGQPLGLHPSFGGPSAGLLACNSSRYLDSMPSYFSAISDTIVPGERAFAIHALYHRLSYSRREKARSFTGTASWLWGFAIGAYLALMGPQGMRRLGEVAMQKAAYAMARLGAIEGLVVPLFASPHFDEFVVNFDRSGQTVVEVNRRLLDRGILGGKDLSGEFPQFGQSALYCVTELHSQEGIDRLVAALAEIL